MAVAAAAHASLALLAGHGGCWYIRPAFDHALYIQEIDR